ncbi:MAG TPA: restriction endonuclease, partial [Candidatus Marinimicrobia bacterium]|nr:restriction endonuclease [Candidatus Neomarinimicrobiota bacterium]
YMLEQDKKHREIFNKRMSNGTLHDAQIHKSLYLWGIDYYHENPHLFFPVGFDEVLYLSGKHNFSKFFKYPYLNDEFILGNEYAFFKWEKSGAWYWLHESPYMGGEFRFIRQNNASEGLDIPFNYVIRTLENTLKKPLNKFCSIVSPRLWTPESQRTEKILLKEASQDIIKALIEQKCTLSDLDWKQFEYIVAEILQDQGIEIHKVVERPQGGKDLIARGELIPGEPMYMAVEIKHSDKVGVGQVRSALKATENYPALLFVTSGRFTSGVINEKRKHSNQLRLFLKDGVALGNMIRQYGILKDG